MTEALRALPREITEGRPVRRCLATWTCALVLAGCRVGPDYHRPAPLADQPGPVTFTSPTSTNLVDWTTLAVTNPAAMPFSWSTNTAALPRQFYRIKVGPPLP